MNDKHSDMFAVADTSSTKRFPSAIALSLLVNAVFLAGASTLMRDQAVPASDNAGYVVLDRFEQVSSAQTPPVARRQRPSSEATRPPHNGRQVARVPVVGGARKTVARTGVAPEIGATVAEATAAESPVVPPARRAIAAETAAATASRPELNRPADPVELAHATAELDGGGGDGTKTVASSAIPGDMDNPEGGEGTAPASPPDSSVTLVPVGETKSAESERQELPRLPDALRESGYRSFVRVRVEVAAAGDFSVTILTSSGNPDIDLRVLDALRRWEWKPALKNGVPVTSTEVLRFDFDVD